MTDITIVNRSSVLTDDQVRAVLPAWSKWANTMVCPAYALQPVVLWFALADDPLAGLFLEILDHADQPGVLGYHTDDRGRVSGRLFAADCLADGVSWTVDGTHELGEMLVDPTASIMLSLPGGAQTIKEICDPVEGDDCAIDVDGVLCSDFVLPGYFSQDPGPWDSRGFLTGPAPTLVRGGYISLFENGQWTQKFAELADGRLSDRARRHTRHMGRHAWRRLNPSP